MESQNETTAFLYMKGTAENILFDRHLFFSTLCKTTRNSKALEKMWNRKILMVCHATLAQYVDGMNHNRDCERLWTAYVSGPACVLTQNKLLQTFSITPEPTIMKCVTGVFCGKMCFVNSY